MWSLVMYSNCFEYNLSKEQMIINLSAIYCYKRYVCFQSCLLPYHYTINNNYIHGIFVASGF